ncbi:hypothetical protein [Klebsiella spallanzanii]|uniref:Colicin V n=1 Tax=Klebsiella spallanzanii TaxID=2587528 RepID=A0A564J9P4_9ENTR|nr:hypothetical protein [Klebsiella spallanzanii]VUS54440.1 hypothetical protein SB6408_04584 [Klebsiella spallanzanii]
MKQLTVFEMEEISGGYSWDFSSISSTLTSLVSNGFELVTAASMGAATYGMIGSIIGGAHGGDGGGLLGIGSAGQGVGMIWGLVVGAIGGGIVGGLMGWDSMLTISTDAYNGIISGTLTPWTH